MRIIFLLRDQVTDSQAGLSIPLFFYVISYVTIISVCSKEEFYYQNILWKLVWQLNCWKCYAKNICSGDKMSRTFRSETLKRNTIRWIFVSEAQQPSSGLGCFIVEVTRSHTIRQSHPAGLLWMRDQLVAETATYTTYNSHKRRTYMPSAKIETKNRQRVKLCLRSQDHRDRQ